MNTEEQSTVSVHRIKNMIKFDVMYNVLYKSLKNYYM